MFSGYLIVPHGTTRTVRLHYIVPPNVFRASGGGRYTLLVPHQPGSHADRIHVRVHHDGVASAWTIDHPVYDWKVVSPINSRPFHPIPLPIVPRSTVQPGYWIEAHAYLGIPNLTG